jgi:hypothetical protein
MLRMSLEYGFFFPFLFFLMVGGEFVVLCSSALSTAVITEIPMHATRIDWPLNLMN